jgi:hypothetical protein
MNRATSTFSAVLFCTFLLSVVGVIVYALGYKAMKEGFIQLEEEVKPEEKATSLEVAKKAALTYKIHQSDAWGKIELMNNEWDSEDTNIEIRYMFHDKTSALFYVIVHPKEQIGGIYISSTPKECMTLVLGSHGEKLPTSENGGFFPGQRILSTFGIVHVLTGVLDGYVTVEPPITKAEIENTFLLLDNPKSSVEHFTVDLAKK